MRLTSPSFYYGTPQGLFLAHEESGHYVAKALAPLPNQVPGRHDTRDVSDKIRDRVLGQRLNGIKVIKQDLMDPVRLFVGTARLGIFRSDNGGNSWRPMNDGLENLEVWSLFQDPESGELFAGTEPAAVYHSRDFGESWEPCANFASLPRHAEWTFPLPPHHAHVKDITLNANTLYSAIEVGWLVRSRDRGATWENLTQGLYADTHSVRIDPRDPKIILVSSGDGFYRSRDGGETFTKSVQGIERRYFSPIMTHPSRPDILFVCASAHPPPQWFIPFGPGADSAFYRSQDEGGSWTRLEPTPHLHGGCWAAAVHPLDPDVFIAGLSDGDIWLSRDGGKSVERVLSDAGVITTIQFARADSSTAGAAQGSITP